MRVLPIGFGIDPKGLCIPASPSLLRFFVSFGQDNLPILFGIRSDLLRLLGSFRAVVLRLSFPLGLHAGEDGFLILFRQVGPFDPNI